MLCPPLAESCTPGKVASPQLATDQLSRLRDPEHTRVVERGEVNRKKLKSCFIVGRKKFDHQNVRTYTPRVHNSHEVEKIKFL